MSFPQSIADGRYTLVEPLGVGGMATVFKAFDQRLQVWRAVKVLAPQYSNRPSLRDRFEAEARTMASLEHRHIVRVYDVGRAGGSPYIVMELVDGGTLVDWVKQHGPMPPRLAVDAMIQTCEGVSAAHARRIVHRDIKPHNVLITAEGLCRVTDFGIARVEDDNEHLTRTGAVFGTWAYMAPEQRADAKKVDARADVYSLGATLYYLVTGRTPMDLFAAEKDPAVMEGIHECLMPVLVKSTQYSRNDRYETVQHFITALVALRETTPVDPPDTPTLGRPNLVAKPPPARPPGGSGAAANPRFSETMVPDGELAAAFSDVSDAPPMGAGGSAPSFDPTLENPDETNPNSRAFVGLVSPNTPSDLPDDAPPLRFLPPTAEDEAPAPRRWPVVVALLLALALLLFFLRPVFFGEPTPTGPAVEAGQPAGVKPPPVEPPPVNPPVGPTVVENPPNPEGGTTTAPPEGEGSTATPGEVTPPTEPPPPPKKKTGRVIVEGDASSVRFLNGGKAFPPGELPPGVYSIEATWGSQSYPAGTVTVRVGATARVRCKERQYLCSAS
ncbi:MAG: protein kinase [Deltaproteobacteria bacterium]|nr:protein kinase [Deltaproteobacteria bacterium]